MEGDDVYKRLYTNLPEDSDSIRLFILLPPLSQAGELLTVLKPASLSADPPPLYNAVSYTWGEPVFESTVLCNGPHNPLPVTPALESVLHHLRQKYLIDVEPDAQLPLWIDGLSINQRDAADKAHQIRRMASVYAQAQATIVWLGAEDETSSFAMELLERLGGLGVPDDAEKTSDENKVAETQEALELSSTSARRSHPTELAQQHVPEMFAPAAWHALDALFSRPFWTRLWVLQEIMLSRNAILLCGDRELPWDKALAAYHCLNRLEWDAPWTNAFSHDVVRLIKKNHYTLMSPFLDRRKPQQPLLARAIETMGLRCLDPRDKLYGLLGICFPDEAERIEVDYTRPVRDVYADFMADRLTEGSGNPYYAAALLLAGSGQFSPQHRSDPTLPSWVVDWAAWSTPNGAHHLYSAQWWWQRLQYQAAGDTAPDIVAAASGGHMNTRGVVIDTVDAAESAILSLGSWEFWEDFIHWDREAEEDGSWYPTGLSWLEVAFRTVLADIERGEMKRLGTNTQMTDKLVAGFIEHLTVAREGASSGSMEPGSSEGEADQQPLSVPWLSGLSS